MHACLNQKFHSASACIFVPVDACNTHGESVTWQRRQRRCMLYQWCLCAAAAAAVLMAKRRAAGSCCCCPRAPMKEDNARFCLLAGLILLYLLCGAAIFSALEHPFELRARLLWKQQLDNFTRRYRVNLGALHTLLRQYEEANGAGIRVDALRPRWDFSGAFYFVGTVVSTIGKSPLNFFPDFSSVLECCSRL